MIPSLLSDSQSIPLTQSTAVTAGHHQPHNNLTSALLA